MCPDRREPMHTIRDASNIRSVGRPFDRTTSGAFVELKASLAKLSEPIPGAIFGIPLCGRTWATCLSPKAKNGEDDKWLRALPGVVALCGREWQLFDAKATEHVGALVRRWRASGAYGIPGARLAWTYCTGQERVDALTRCALKVADRQIADIRRAAKQEKALRQLGTQVAMLARQIG